MFVIGALPALLCVLIMRRLKEPERWRQAATSAVRLGSMTELFSDPRWRRNAIVGMLLAFAGVVGLWGIGNFSVDLLRTILDRTSLTAGQKTFWTSMTLLLQNFGAFGGIYAFTHLTHRVGRRRAFAITFVAAMATTAFTFWNLDSFGDIFWMVPLMGACQLALFGGYAIYLPELFPTRLRSTGTSLCYNVGRLVAAVGSARARAVDEPRVRGARRADAVRRRDDVGRVPDRAGDGAVRAGDARRAAAPIAR